MANPDILVGQRCRRCGEHTEVEIHQITVPSPSSQERINALETELAATQLQLKEAREAYYAQSCDLAATQLALKEAREALRKARTRIVEHGGSGWKCSVTQIDLILSHPADTTALNRYVAEELRRMSSTIAQYKCYDAQIDIERRADELEGK